MRIMLMNAEPLQEHLPPAPKGSEYAIVKRVILHLCLLNIYEKNFLLQRQTNFWTEYWV